ncbi:MAG: PEGA domain-containing protein [Planctomycetes bacterium]|nr:PEGA domain-containing protein [Planctomycetota bacterium]
MEFVTVKYWRRRNVYINGEKSGYTNMTLRTNRGTKVFTLSDPPNYEPTRRRVTVQNTTVIKPLVVSFKKKET